MHDENKHLSILQDTQRLEKLRRLCLLDTSADPAFDRLTRLASDILGMPISLVSLIDVDRQFFKSQMGLPEPWATRRHTPLTHSFCQHVVTSNEALIVADAREDSLLKDNLAIQDMDVIAYAGIPLTTSDDLTLGSFCVIDSKPHDWTENEIRVLRDLAASVVTEIELRSELLERQEAEKALQQQEVFLHHLIDNIPNIIYLKNDKGRIVLANQALADLYETTPESLVGKTECDLIEKVDISSFREGDQQVLDTGIAMFIGEAPIKYVDGSERWFQTVKTLLHNQNDTQPLILVSATDITKRKKMKESLHQALQETQRIVDISLDLIGTVSFGGYLTQINPAFERILGFSSEELLTRPLIEFVHPDDVDLTQIETNRMIKEGIANTFENRYQTKRGDYRWLSWKAIPDLEKQLTHFVARDITDERAIQEIVRQSEQQYQQILDNIEDFVLLKGPQSRIVWANRAFRDYYGMSNEELQGLIDAPFVEPDYTEQYIRDDEQVFRTGKTLDIPEEPVTRSDGVVRYFHTVKSPILIDDEVIMIVGISRDITERKLADEKLQAALMKEKHLNEMKSQFISMVSHEFKNPLAVILSSTELLKNYSDRISEDKKMRKLETIMSHVQRMTNLLNDTLTLIRSDMVGFNFNPIELDLHDFCEMIVDEIQLICEATHTVVFSASGESDKVLLDDDLLRHVLTNLLSNAVKYSPEGGIISFELLYEHQDITIRIKDEGIGIPKGDQEDLFESFRRANNVGNISGTGLGLVIAKQAVEAHGGTIDFESEENVGTTFIISIPRYQHQVANES